MVDGWRGNFSLQIRVKINENESKSEKRNWVHESNVNSYGNRKFDVTIIGEKIINWGLIDKDKNKWEWKK